MNTKSHSSLSHLKFRHLQLIKFLLELGTLHKAARALNISQPAVTAMLTDLESTIGFKLFERNHQGTKPTTSCIKLNDSIQTLLNDYSNFSNSILRINQGKEQLLRIGIVPQAFSTYFPQVVAEFREKGGCSIRTEEGTALSLLMQLWEGRLDCIIGRLPNAGVPENINLESLQFEVLYNEQISVVCGAAIENKSKSTQTYEWLASKEWILQRRDSSVRQALNEAFLRAGIAPPSPVVETMNYIQSLALVSNSSFLTVAPTVAAKAFEKNGAVRILNIDLKVSPMHVSCITRAVSNTNEQLQLFVATFKETLRKFKGT